MPVAVACMPVEKHGATSGILIVAFNILIAREREDGAPLFLVPV